MRTLMERTEIDMAGDHLVERVAQLYEEAFWANVAAQDFLHSFGLVDRALWREFRIGYCDGSAILPGDERTLKALGILERDGEAHFRDCVVVPLTMPGRGVVSFYGLNRDQLGFYPDVYLRRRPGVFNLKAVETTSDFLYITETVLDALSFLQSGIRNVTSLHGSSGLFADLRELLLRHRHPELVLALYGDWDGGKACSELTARLELLAFNVIALTLPQGYGPNRLLRERGPAGLVEVLQCSR